MTCIFYQMKKFSPNKIFLEAPTAGEGADCKSCGRCPWMNLNNANKKNNLKVINHERNWPELFWEKDKNIEIISNENILNSLLLGENFPNYLENLSFKNLKLKLGPDFRIQYAGIVKAYLDTKLDINFKGKVGEDLNARGLITLSKGTANLYTTPFKLD